MAVARREEQEEEETEDEQPMLGVTLLLLARGDAWASEAARAKERGRVQAAVALWEGMDVVVVEYRDDDEAAASSSSLESFLKEEEVEGQGRVRVLPFVVDGGGRDRLVPKHTHGQPPPPTTTQSYHFTHQHTKSTGGVCCPSRP